MKERVIIGGLTIVAIATFCLADGYEPDEYRKIFGHDPVSGVHVKNGKTKVSVKENSIVVKNGDENASDGKGSLVAKDGNFEVRVKPPKTKCPKTIENLRDGDVAVIIDDEKLKAVLTKEKSKYEYGYPDEAGVWLDRPYTVDGLLRKLGEIKGESYMVYGNYNVQMDPEVKITSLKNLVSYMKKKYGVSIKTEKGEEITKVYVESYGGKRSVSKK